MLCPRVSLFSKIFVSWSMPSCLSPSHALDMKPSVQAGDLSSLIAIIRYPIHCPTLILLFYVPFYVSFKWLGSKNLIGLSSKIFHNEVPRQNDSDARDTPNSPDRTTGLVAYFVRKPVEIDNLSHHRKRSKNEWYNNKVFI